jgi:hypothetical protein
MYQLGDIVNNHYEVIGILSPLAVGPVFRALQRKTGMHVFLWVIDPKLLPDVADRQAFVQQLTRSYGVRHPNAVPLIDLFIDRDHAVLGLQYYEGATIDTHVERRAAAGAPLGRAEAWTAIEQVASACGQYHQLGLAIGALRPEVVLMTPIGAMVFDPAVALAIPRKKILAAMKRRGRWHYLAPEMRAVWPVDRRVDIYSLAAIAHLILYGVPYGWPDGARRGLFARMGHRLRFGGRPRMKGHRWTYADQVLRASLSGNPHDRAPDVESFCRMLHQALAASPEPVVAAPEPVVRAVVQAPVSAAPAATAPPIARTMQAQAVQPPLIATARTVEAPPSAQPPPVADVPTAIATPRAPVADARTAIATPHAAAARADEFDAPLTEASPPPEFDAPRADAPPPAERVVELVAPPTMELRATDLASQLVEDQPAPQLFPSLAQEPDSRPDMVAPTPELVAPTPTRNENRTRQVDVAEIASLLANTDPDDSRNKTREINSAEIEALLARTREDPPEK